MGWPLEARSRRKRGCDGGSEWKRERKVPGAGRGSGELGVGTEERRRVLGRLKFVKPQTAPRVCRSPGYEEGGHRRFFAGWEGRFVAPADPVGVQLTRHTPEVARGGVVAESARGYLGVRDGTEIDGSLVVRITAARYEEVRILRLCSRQTSAPNQPHAARGQWKQSGGALGWFWGRGIFSHGGKFDLGPDDGAMGCH